MIELIKIELRKALKNKIFYATILVAIGITILSLIYSLSIYKKSNIGIDEYAKANSIVYNPDVQTNILFNEWIGGEGGSLGTVIYYFIFPILCALPYGWSFCTEKKNGYRKTIIVQSGKKEYFVAKYIATFISGGLVMVLPLIANFMMTACFFPAVKPFVVYDIYYAVFPKNMMAELFYSRPFLYVFLYLCIDFIFCGILTCLCISAATFIRQKYVVMIIPFLLCLGINFFMNSTYDNSKSGYKELSPFYFLKPIQSRYPSTFAIVGGMALILFIITFVITQIWERKHEIY